MSVTRCRRTLALALTTWLAVAAHADAQGPTFTDLGAGLIGASDSSLAWIDYDSDGRLDLLITGQSTTGPATTLYRVDGEPPPTFTVVVSGLAAVSDGALALGDYDNDGDVDILLTGVSAGATPVTKLYRNDTEQWNPTPIFTEVPTPFAPVYESAASWGDYDNDGDVDLLLAGRTASGRTAKIYRNDRDGVFVDSGISLTGVSAAAGDWCDYDADGDLDFVLAGDDGVGPFTTLYQNTNGAFATVAAGLANMHSGTVAWGDYDSDGALDLLLTGIDGSSARVTKLYRNAGGGTFSEIPAALTGTSNGTAAWGDYDNDGDSDLVVTGNTDLGRTSIVYRNEGGGVFVDAGAGLPALQGSAAAWADVDMDGDLDLAMAGHDGSTPASFVFLSDGAPTNTAPGAPQPHEPVVNGREVTLSWDAATDDTTPPSALSYNVGVGLQEDSDHPFWIPGILSPMTLPYKAIDGRLVARSGNTGSRKFVTLENVPRGVYVWAIQTIDAGLQPSYLDPSYGFIVCDLEIDQTPIIVPASGGIVSRTLLAAPGCEWRITNDPGWIWQPDWSGVGPHTFELASDPNNGPARTGTFTVAGLSISVTQEDGCAYVLDALAKSFPDAGGTADFLVNVAAGCTWTAASNDPWIHVTSGSSGTGWGRSSISVDPNPDGRRSGSLTLAGHTVTIAQPYPFTKIDVADVAGIGDGGAVAAGDYDGDGDLDLAVAGSEPSGTFTRIYRTNGDGTFTDANAGLPGLVLASLAWGDYDGDGDLDLAALGETNLDAVTKVFRNDGGTFSDIGPMFVGVMQGSLAWGDYDGDGDLDLVASGVDLSLHVMTKVYRNDGASIFRVAFNVAARGAVAWGDYDNDGDLDFVLAGGPVSTLFRNDSGQFIDVQAGFPVLGYTGAAWGDSDNDGDLDLMLQGYRFSDGMYSATLYRNANGTLVKSDITIPSGTSGVLWGDYDNDGDLDLLTTAGIGQPAVYRNDGGSFVNVDAHLPSDGLNNAGFVWGDYDGDGDLDVLGSEDLGPTSAFKILRNDVASSADSAPTAPTALDALVSFGDVALSWNPSSDRETATAGLTYNLRVGTTPGAANVVAPMSRISDGRRQVPALGNMQHGTTASLALGPGTYYWSVQAVDTAFVGSPFAPEKTFTIVPRAKLRFATAAVRVAEADSAARLTVIRAGNLSIPTTVTYSTSDGTAKAGQDFTQRSGVLTFAANQSAKTILVPVIHDTKTEHNENFRVTLSNPTGWAELSAPPQATVTIVDNGSIVQFSALQYAVKEFAKVATVTVRRTGNVAVPLTVPYAVSHGTATYGTDYISANGSVTFAAGSTSEIFTIRILNDVKREGPETINLALKDPVGMGALGARTTATLVIVDDEL